MISLAPPRVSSASPSMMASSWAAHHVVKACRDGAPHGDGCHWTSPPVRRSRCAAKTACSDAPGAAGRLLEAQCDALCRHGVFALQLRHRPRPSRSIRSRARAIGSCCPGRLQGYAHRDIWTGRRAGDADPAASSCIRERPVPLRARARSVNLVASRRDRCDVVAVDLDEPASETRSAGPTCRPCSREGRSEPRPRNRCSPRRRGSAAVRNAAMFIAS